MHRFLIIQTAFLGDVILMTPLVSELRRIYPEAIIDVVVRKGNESLLENHPKINRLLIWNKQENKYRNLWKTIRAIRKVEYDEVITLQRYFNAGLMTLFSKTKKRIGFRQNSLSWMYAKKTEHSLLEGTHEVERNLRLISHHKAVVKKRPELFPSEADYKRVSPFQEESYFCIAPASVWNTKRLPLHKWEEVIKMIHQKGKVYFIGGPDDYDLCNQLHEKFPNTTKNLAGKLSLLQSAALMEKATMNYVNDSGSLHLASAMNAPTRAFFCSTVPLFGFGPLADDSKIIEINKKLECRPCTFHGRKKCPLGHYDCGNEIVIKEEEVL